MEDSGNSFSTIWRNFFLSNGRNSIHRQIRYNAKDSKEQKVAVYRELTVMFFILEINFMR